MTQTRIGRSGILTHWAILLGLLTVLAGCNMRGGDAKSADADAEEEDPPIPVEVAEITRGDIVAVYSGTAALEAEGEAEVVAKVGGEIVALLAEEGDVVEAGQVLARIDARQLRLELEQTQANVRKLEQDYQRNLELHDKGLLSAGAFEGMKYDLEALRAAAKLARLQLSYTQIKAPLAGVITLRHVKAGNTIRTNDPVFHIADMEPLLAYLHVPEMEFRKLANGQDAALFVDALPGQQFVGRIQRISPVVDPQSGTFKVTIEVDDGAKLKPGMFGRFNIVYDTHEQALQVQRAAIVDDQTDPAVFVVEDGVAKRRSVTLGYSYGANVEVLEGLTDGERVIVIGQSGLKDGGKVAVVGDEAPDTLREEPVAESTLVAEDGE